MILQANAGAVKEIYVAEAEPRLLTLLQKSQDMTNQEFLDETYNRKLTTRVYDDEP